MAGVAQGAQHGRFSQKRAAATLFPRDCAPTSKTVNLACSGWRGLRSAVTMRRSTALTARRPLALAATRSAGVWLQSGAVCEGWKITEVVFQAAGSGAALVRLDACAIHVPSRWLRGGPGGVELRGCAWSAISRLETG